MSDESLFIINKSSVVLTTFVIDLFYSYMNHYIRDGYEKIEEYEREATEIRLIEPSWVSQEEHSVADMQRELNRAESLRAELGQVRGHIVHVYDRNFRDWAEVFRQTRLELGLEKIEDSPELYAAVKHVMTMLKEENPRFSESKFIKYINN